MEDTKSLLMMVLQKVFKNRPKIVEETFQLIFCYNNGKREKREYEKTLKNICDLMNDELPSQILVYLLTMVDMPKEGGGQLPIMEKMQKTHSCLAESVRPHLLQFLKHTSTIDQTTLCENHKTERKTETVTADEHPKEEENQDNNSKSTQDNSDDECFLKPAAKRLKKKVVKKKIIGTNSDENIRKMETLLDLNAVYVVQNEKKLKKMYKYKLDQAWKLINKNVFREPDLSKCYDVVRDLNRKLKLLRMIENDKVTTEILMEEYKDHDIFLKEQHMYDILNKEPFEMTEELINQIFKM